MRNVVLERKPRVTARTGWSRSTLHEKIHEGLFPAPVKIGTLSTWPDFETDQILAARIAGRSEDEIRVLVRRLIDARKSLTQRVGLAEPEAA
jgi:prophage regulatory protein